MSLVGFKGQNHPQQVGKRGAKDKVDDRGTPQDLFDELSARFGGFTLDAAAAPHNAKCDRYWTLGEDGLSKPWDGRVWCNPPYSDIGAWVRKAWSEWLSGRCDVVVMLLPANRTEQTWWQDHVEPDLRSGKLRVEFLRGRLRFIQAGRTEVGPNERPPFGCCLLIWSTPDEKAAGSLPPRRPFADARLGMVPGHGAAPTKPPKRGGAL